VVVVDAGETATCRVTNTKLASITIDKVTSPAGDPTSFSFTSTGLSPSSFELTHAATPRQFVNVTPGQSYTITESVPTGWTLVTSGTGCTATTNGVTVTSLDSYLLSTQALAGPLSIVMSSNVLQQYFEGKIDFVGQQRVEDIAKLWLFSFTALSFALGFALQSLRITFGLMGFSTAVLCIVVLPAWPMYNAHPVRWLPVQGSTEDETSKSK
jgi:signal peptidase complex subunit 1